jgi:hypothetical protein
MMKIKREQLKAIVKECLVELLQEGLGGLRAPVSESRQVRDYSLDPLPGHARRSTVPAGAVDPAAVRRRTMDLMEHGARPQPSPIIHEAQRQRQQAVSQVVANAAPNPLMAAIFADTANTTFAAQEGNSAHVPGDQATKAVAAADPMSMFGGDKVNVWNQMAFAPGIPTRSDTVLTGFATERPKGE